MSFKKGKVNVTAFRLVESINETDIERALSYALAASAKPLNTVMDIDEPSGGWVSGTMILEEIITQENSYIGEYLFLNYRQAVKKINGELLNAYCEKAEAEYIERANAEYLPAKVRREIRQEAIEKLAQQATLCIKVIPVAIRGNLMLVGATSQTDIDEIACLVYKTLGVEPQQINASHMAALLNEQDVEFSLGREFLTWLYWNHETDQGEYGDAEIAVNAPLDFISNEDGKGCTNAVTKGDRAPIANESFAALREGKFLRKAKLSIVRGDDIWEGSFDADKFTFSSLELPHVESGTLAETFTDRMDLISELVFDIMQPAFQEFMQDHKSPDYNDRLQDWIKSL